MGARGAHSTKDATYTQANTTPTIFIYPHLTNISAYAKTDIGKRNDTKPRKPEATSLIWAEYARNISPAK